MFRLRYYLLLLNNYKFFRILKWAYAFFTFQWIKIQRFFIDKGITSKKKKRIFCTNGNLSLINALTIIEQLDKKNCDDYLIIHSFGGSYNFWKNNYDIAKLHNFKGIRLLPNVNLLRDLKLTGWAHFDEIYVLNLQHTLPFIMKMYPEAEVNLLDEGCVSLINKGKSLDDRKDIKYFYTHNYIDKFDNYGFPEHLLKKIVPLDTSIFGKISAKIAEQYPILTSYDKDGKNILYCSIFWQASGLTKEKYIETQNKQINDLLQAGYKILFKPHPRDTEFYGIDKNPNITIIDSVLPVEMYRWDVLAMTGMNCGTLIHLSHYNNIPTFSNIIDEALYGSADKSFSSNFIRYCLKEYSPDYQELLKLDVKNTSRKELKVQIKKIYDDFIKDKPLLSQNNKIKEFSEKYGIN